MATCIVSGTFVNPQGGAVSGAPVRFNIDSPVLDASGNLLMPKEITTTTASDGTWSLTITQNVSGVLVLDLTPSSTSAAVKYTFSLVIPAVATATFASCWADSATFGGQSVSNPLTFASVAGTLAAAQLPALPSADVWVGNSSNLATAVAISGDVSLSNSGVCAVNTVGGSTAANIHSGELLANTATSSNTASSVVKRDPSGNFSAGTITASLTGHSSLDLQASNNLSDVTARQTAINNLVGNVLTTGFVLRGSGSNAIMAALVANDIPTLNQNTTGSAASFTGSLAGDVTGTQAATAVSKINGVTVSGTTGTGNVVFATSPTITNAVVGTQSQLDGSTKAASTSYVDTAVANAVSGVNPAVAVQAATTSASDTSGFTYTSVAGIGDFFTGSVGTAVVIDGFTFTALGQRLLIKDDTHSPSGSKNGVYYVTQVQTGILAPILTRALDFDTSSDINNTGAIPVVNGTVNGTTSYVVTSSVTTVGTDPITFTKFTRNPADYLLKSNNLSDVSSASSAFNNISPITSTGDLILGNGTNSGTRLAKGTQYQTLQTGASTLAYDAIHLDQAAAVTGVLPNTSTTATSANTASAIVARDSSGNFSAGTITASLTGNATNVTGTVAVANGGTGLQTLTSNNVILGNGASNVQFVAPGTSGNVLTSNGTTWSSSASASGPVVNTATALITAYYLFS